MQIRHIFIIKIYDQANNSEYSLSNLGRVTDGLILCESSDGYMDQHIQTVKGKVKEFHKAVTAYRKSDNSNLSLKQIENAQFGIYYKVTDRVTFTVIV